MARKTGMMGSAYVTESRPKKLVKGEANIQNTQQRPVTRLVKDTEGRVVNVLSHQTSRNKLSGIP